VRLVRLGPAGWVGAALLLGFLLVVIGGDVLAPHPAGARPGVPYARPGTGHLLGTDDVGRDLYSLLVLGARTSLAIGLGVAALSTLIGAAVGGVAGLSRGWVDTVLMRLVDVVLSLPFLPLLIVVAAFAGRGIGTQVVLIAALTWARPARIIRAAVLAARGSGHVEVAEGMGATRTRVLLRHASFTVAPLLIPVFVRAGMGAILLEASLAFLGLGDPSRASWGTTLYWANVRGAFLSDAWLWWVLPPGLAIAGLVVALGLVGVAVEERLNPSLALGT
jgi:ABC-type dipeptide/oligopeptide/nickel transport system permease subunit